MTTARRWAWVIGTALGALLLCIGTALLVPAHAAPKASSPGLTAEGTYAGAGGSTTGTFEMGFECNAHASVPVTATAVDSCLLYHRTPTGWKRVAAAPAQSVPGGAAATGGRYTVSMSDLAGLRVCWKTHAVPVSGTTPLTATGCYS